MSSKAVYSNGVRMMIPESVLVQFGLFEGQRLSEAQAIQITKMTAGLAVTKPKPNPDHLPGCPH